MNPIIEPVDISASLLTIAPIVVIVVNSIKANLNAINPEILSKYSYIPMILAITASTLVALFMFEIHWFWAIMIGLATPGTHEFSKLLFPKQDPTAELEDVLSKLE